MMHNNKRLQQYLYKLRNKKRNGFSERSFSVRGYLKIYDNANNLVFDDHNLIVDEGKGYVMDLLAELAFSPTYTLSPLGAIILTNNTATEQSTDTFATSVFDSGAAIDYISDEGVLHIPTWSPISRSEGDLSLSLSATITQPYGNDTSNNHINSVTLVAGTNDSAGGPGEAAYSSTGNEKLFARVHVGDLVKTVEKSYNFQWYFLIS